MYTVIVCNYDELLEKTIENPEFLTNNYLPDNGGGKEYAGYIIIKHNDTILAVESDAMEPEDATFYRDLNWIKKALELAYKLGYEDAEKGMKC